MDIAIAKSITYARKPIPDQLARPPLKIPRNKTAAMMHTQQLSRQHGWWTRGVVTTEKLPGLVAKFDSRFGILDPARTTARKRARGQPTAQLVVYRQIDTDNWLWWLLIAGRPEQVKKLADHHRETLLPIHDRHTPMLWADEYEMRKGQRGSMTWFMQRKTANDVEAELRYFASGHGSGRDRTDDLIRAVARARNRPMFSGVRQQVGRSLAKSVRRWKKTHPASMDYPADSSRLPWFVGSVKIYDDPPAVIVPAG